MNKHEIHELYYDQFKKENPQTVGETDKNFDLSNYADWLEMKLHALSQQPDYIEILPDGSNLPNDNEVVMCWHKGEWIKGKMAKVGDSVLWYYEGNTTLTYELPKFYFRLPSSPITNPPAAAEQR